MKFYLKWNLSDPKPRNLPGWSGRIGQRFYNRVGGWQSGPLKSFRIVGSVDLPDWDDIEHSEEARTLMFKASQIVRKNIIDQNPDHNIGWVSPEGGWYPCWYQDHDAMALYAFGKPVAEIETDHVRAWGIYDKELTLSPPTMTKITPAQSKTLRKLGYEVHWSEIL